MVVGSGSEYADHSRPDMTDPPHRGRLTMAHSCARTRPNFTLLARSLKAHMACGAVHPLDQLKPSSTRTVTPSLVNEGCSCKCHLESSAALSLGSHTQPALTSLPVCNQGC